MVLDHNSSANLAKAAVIARSGLCGCEERSKAISNFDEEDCFAHQPWRAVPGKTAAQKLVMLSWFCEASPRCNARCFVAKTAPQHDNSCFFAYRRAVWNSRNDIRGLALRHFLVDLYRFARGAVPRKG